MSPRRLAILGTGLIGASIGLAARRAGVGAVAGYDPDRETLESASERQAVEPAASLEEAVDGAELVVCAGPVASLPQQVAAALAASSGATVTDVGKSVV